MSPKSKSVRFSAIVANTRNPFWLMKMYLLRYTESHSGNFCSSLFFYLICCFIRGLCLCIFFYSSIHEINIILKTHNFFFVKKKQASNFFSSHYIVSTSRGTNGYVYCLFYLFHGTSLREVQIWFFFFCC